MPKVKKPKKGWFIPKKRKIRRGPAVKPSERGLPPCPSCGEWSMQKDEARNEIYCGACGTTS
jgi:ribosomal protein S27AE|tara:strand:+ start:919 stop:1104 length:186 start_codon:yes stop_codon:yes gene_type:complete